MILQKKLEGRNVIKNIRYIKKLEKEKIFQR